MSAQRVCAELIANQSVQSLEALAPIDGFDSNIDFCRQSQPEHPITPRLPVSIASDRLRRTSTSSRSAGHWPTPARILPLAVLQSQLRLTSACPFVPDASNPAC